MNNFSMLNKFIIFIIEWYQKTISKDHSSSATGFCRFTPSCSEYSKTCFKKHNFFKALLKSIWRIMRCHPWAKGGIDLP
jgi:uncharacterized protein